jgi:hypothetical protein
LKEERWALVENARRLYQQHTRRSRAIQKIVRRFRTLRGDSKHARCSSALKANARRFKRSRGVSKHRDAFQKIARRSKAPRGVLAVSRENCLSHWIDRVKFIGKCRYKYYQRFTIFHLDFCKIKILYFTCKQSLQPLNNS